MSKDRKHYQIFMVKEVQVLVKKTTQEDGHKIDFMCYPENSENEVLYSLTFKELALRDALFNLICSPTEYSKNFIADIASKYLNTDESNSGNSVHTPSSISRLGKSVK